ncbi:MAG: S41 family peptidase [Candidatus Paceibacterota bacterium]
MDGGSLPLLRLWLVQCKNTKSLNFRYSNFWKGSVQELIDFKDKTELKITVAEWLTPDGTSISKEGLTPDFVVEFDSELYKKNKTDNQLEEAAKILLKINLVKKS